MPTFAPGLEPLGKEGGWGDKELQQRREKRENDGRGDKWNAPMCVPARAAVYVPYLYLYISHRAYDKRVGGGGADAMQLNVVKQEEQTLQSKDQEQAQP